MEQEDDVGSQSGGQPSSKRRHWQVCWLAFNTECKPRVLALLCTSRGSVCTRGLTAEATAMKCAAVLISRHRAISSCRHESAAS